MTGAAKASARRRVSSSCRLARTCGRFVRWLTAGVQVDAVAALADDFLHEQKGDAGGERAAVGAGEGAVEVAAVGQVARLGVEAEHVDDRHGDEAAGEVVGRDALEDAADDFDAVDLVAVDGGADPGDGPGLAAVDDDDGQRQARAGGQLADGDFQPAAFAGIDEDAGDFDGGINRLGQSS